MENKFIENFKKNNDKGITLMVLVITIIILIILSTVTISAVFGDGGLIEQAKETQSDATNLMYSRDENMDELLKEYSNMMKEEGSIENPNENDIENPGTDEPTLPEGWNGDKVEAVESGDGKTVPVPKGYVASKASNENTVQGGFVIYEGEEDVTDSNVATAKTSRNQFVWVPVNDVSDIANLTSGYDTAGRPNYQGKLYDFSSSGATEMSGYGQGTGSYREPDIVDDDNVTANISIIGVTSGNELKQKLQLEFNEIIESIDIYGGFYIGRYETGNLISSIGAEPIIVKGNATISDVNWYYMYRNLKELAANNNVKSTMIWGSMWDRTLIWLAETNTDSSGKYGRSYTDIISSDSWGNYNGGKQAAGYSEIWKANNIYDLAGNVEEWTVEVRTYNHVHRGGDYYYTGSEHPASYRDQWLTPTQRGANRGTRAVLYITP